MSDTQLTNWLRQREAADWSSRSEPLTEAVVTLLPRTDVVRVVDLATGSGSNFRYLATRLPAQQDWLLVDRSPALLADGEARVRQWAVHEERAFERTRDGFRVWGKGLDCVVRVRQQDLHCLDDHSLFDGRHLVTGSALLDLVSDAWLNSLAAQCRAAGASALFTITYDGRSACLPVEPEDEWVRHSLNEHQLGDKGLGGPAAGPRAAACAVRRFQAVGYEVRCATSDWILTPGDGAMQRTLIDGWADAASEVTSGPSDAIAQWRARRLAHVDANRSRITVGHQDVAAWPKPSGDGAPFGDGR